LLTLHRKELKTMFQRIEIVGHLGRDPEMRYTPTGAAVTHFSLASNRRWTTEEGETNEETTWFRVTTWSGLAENCNAYLTKGRQVFIEGRLQPDPETGGPRVWAGDDGIPRAQFEVTAHRVIFLGKSEGERSPGSPPKAPPMEEDDPIPF
jgi:single-strand DNA-binding protein